MPGWFPYFVLSLLKTRKAVTRNWRNHQNRCWHTVFDASGPSWTMPSHDHDRGISRWLPAVFVYLFAGFTLISGAYTQHSWRSCVPQSSLFSFSTKDNTWKQQDEAVPMGHNVCSSSLCHFLVFVTSNITCLVRASLHQFIPFDSRD